MDEELTEYYAMHGTICEWDSGRGHIITEAGDRIYLTELQLRYCGFEGQPKVGDQIHFWAEKQVTVTYKVKRARVLVPQEPDTKTFNRLEKAVSQKGLRENGYALQTITGTIDTFDQKERQGFIRTDEGELVFVKAPALTRADLKRLKDGSSATLRLLLAGQDRMIANIVTLTPPKS